MLVDRLYDRIAHLVVQLRKATAIIHVEERHPTQFWKDCSDPWCQRVREVIQQQAQPSAEDVEAVKHAREALRVRV